MKKMYVIYGERDSGKTHTMWLVLAHILGRGAKLVLPMFHAEKPLTYDEIMARKEQLSDFRAVVEWYDKKIMLFSAGDELDEWKYWGFRRHINWASQNDIDYVICCARSRNIEGSVYRELKDVYRNQILDDEDWFFVEKADNKTDWLQDRDKVAQKIIRSLKNAIMNEIPTHYRVFFPVGQGGLAVERIEDMTVVYDCGSLSSPARVEMYIDELKRRQVHQIDYIFISHFDQDHVNGIEYLLKSGIRVHKAIMSYIPHDFQVVYNWAVRGAYENMLILLRRYECGIDVVNEGENSERHYMHKDLWEWIAHSQLTSQDFVNLRQAFVDEGIDLNRLNDIWYLEQNKEDINNVFKETFGPQGPNSKGLIVLSQKTLNTQLYKAELENGICYCSACKSFRCLSMTPTVTGCLYVGDAKIKTQEEVDVIKQFLHHYMHEKHLLLMQLPHHGSNLNIAKDLHFSIDADVYFVNDKDEKRIQKSAILYNDLITQHRLYVIKDMCSDLILGTTKVQ